MRRFGRLAGAAILVLASGAALGGEAASTDGAPVDAVWVDHDLGFTYAGFTSHYTCGGIEGKVKYVLKQLGARPGYKVNAAGCYDSGPELMLHVRVRAALPMPATPEVLAAIEKTRAKSELAARANGKPAASGDAATAQFPATWRVVTFDSSPMSDVQDGDCELMEQLVDKVFLPMGVREMAGSRLNCVPNQHTQHAVSLKVRVLSAPAEAVPPKAPAPR